MERLKTLLSELAEMDVKHHTQELPIEKMIRDIERSIDREENQLDFDEYQGHSKFSILRQKIKIELIKIQLDALTKLKQ